MRTLARNGAERATSVPEKRFAATAGSLCSRLAVGMVLAVVVLGSFSSFADASVSVRFPAEYRTWNIEQSGVPDARVSSWSVPWISTVGLGPTTTVVLSGRGTGSHLSRPDQGVDRFDEVSVQLRQQTQRIPLTFVLGLSAPGSSEELSPDRREVREWLTHPLLGMRGERVGQGVDFGVAALWSPRAGAATRWVLGIGLDVPGSYRIGELDDYRRGAEYSASVGVEHAVLAANRSFRDSKGSETAAGSGYQDQGESVRPKAPWVARWSARVTARTFGRDDLDGAEGIREGDQLDVSLRFERPLADGRLTAGGQASWKGGGVRAEPDLFDVTSPGWLVASDVSWVYLARPLRPGFRIEGRRLGGTRDDARYGWSYGVGPTLSAGQRLRFGADVLYLHGRWEEGRAEARGLSVRATFGYSF